MVFDVGEGPRVYVERIDIRAIRAPRTRSSDAIPAGQGDALNASAVRRSRQRLQDLGYFNNVQITNSPGSAPDKVIINTNIDEKATGELTLGGGYSTDAGFLINAGLRERNLLGTGIDAGVNGVLAQRRSSIDLSVTDPYFLDRNLVAGFDLFALQTNLLDVSQYQERRYGTALRLGYAFNDHLRQSWAYTLVDRDMYHIATTRASTSRIRRAGPAVTARHDVHARLSRQHGRPAFGLRHPRRNRRRRAGRRRELRPHEAGRDLFLSARSLDREQRLGGRDLRRSRISVQRGPAGTDHRPVLPGWRQSARLPGGRRRAAHSKYADPTRRGQHRRTVHLHAVDRAAFPVADFG